MHHHHHSPSHLKLLNSLPSHLQHETCNSITIFSSKRNELLHLAVPIAAVFSTHLHVEQLILCFLLTVAAASLLPLFLLLPIFTAATPSTCCLAAVAASTEKLLQPATCYSPLRAIAATSNSCRFQPLHEKKRCVVVSCCHHPSLDNIAEACRNSTGGGGDGEAKPFIKVRTQKI